MAHWGAVSKLEKHVRDSKSLLVLGAGKTGHGLALVFSKAGRTVTVLDENKLPEDSGREFLENDIVYYDEQAVDDFWATKPDLDFAVKSPGISPDSEVVKKARSLGVRFVSELDLLYALSGKPSVAVTGTNGKTTVCSLINQMLVYSGLKSKLLGNVGRPMASILLGPLVDKQSLESELRGEPRDVFEVSSYQLEEIEFFAPKIGVWLNLNHDHLERHGDMDSYMEAKGKLFSNQSAKHDWAVLNIDDPYFSRFEKAAKGSIFPFGTLTESLKNSPHGCFYDQNTEQVTFLAGNIAARFDLSKTPLIGSHNRVNLTAAIAASMLSGASVGAIEFVVERFCPLPHRMELVRVIDGVKYINDSKATNVASAVAGVKSILEDVEGQLFLLLGGQAKKGEWEEIAEVMRNEKINPVCFGGSSEQVANELLHFGTEVPPEQIHPSLSEAFYQSFAASKDGDVVLLSPGCASFDAYSSFEERGEDFSSMVDRASAGLFSG